MSDLLNITKKNILLISPKKETTDNLTYPPIPLCLLATLLQDTFQVRIFDGFLNDRYISDAVSALNINTVCVGLTVMTEELEAAVEASKSIKLHNPKIPIVWGGDHPTLFLESTIAANYVDIIVHNEGAFTFKELVNTLASGGDLAKVKGICYKINGKSHFTGEKELEREHPNKYPVINYDFVDIETYITKNAFTKMLNNLYGGSHRVGYLLTGMGCESHCKFCINPCLKRTYRSISAKMTHQMMLEYHKKYNLDSFIFIDDNYASDRTRLEELCSLIESDGRVFYMMRICARANFFDTGRIDRALAIRLHKNGLRFLQIGLESGSERIREGYYEKGINEEQLINSATVTSGLKGLSVKYTCILGHPNEDFDDALLTFRLIIKIKFINPNARYSIFWLVPQPGTNLFHDLVPASGITSNTSIEDWIDFMKSRNNILTSNLIDNPRMKIAVFYFNLFIIIHAYKLPRSNPMSRIIYKLILIFIYARFLLIPTSIPIFYHFCKRIPKFTILYSLICDDGF